MGLCGLGRAHVCFRAVWHLIFAPSQPEHMNLALPIWLCLPRCTSPKEPPKYDEQGVNLICLCGQLMAAEYPMQFQAAAGLMPTGSPCYRLSRCSAFLRM